MTETAVVDYGEILAANQPEFCPTCGSSDLLKLGEQYRSAVRGQTVTAVIGEGITKSLVRKGVACPFCTMRYIFGQVKFWADLGILNLPTGGNGIGVNWERFGEGVHRGEISLEKSKEVFAFLESLGIVSSSLAGNWLIVESGGGDGGICHSESTIKAFTKAEDAFAVARITAAEEGCLVMAIKVDTVRTFIRDKGEEK